MSESKTLAVTWLLIITVFSIIAYAFAGTSVALQTAVIWVCVCVANIALARWWRDGGGE